MPLEPTWWSAVLAALAAWVVIPPSPAARLHALDGVRRIRRPMPARLMRLIPGSRARAGRRRLRNLEAAAALAAEMRSGQPARTAVTRSLGGLAPRTLAAARWGGDVPDGLRADAAAQREPLWLAIAACWEVAETSGAGLADAVDRLVVSARASEEIRTQLAGHLAAPRATARLLATLPIIGLLMGMGLGADPLGWLLGHPIGRLMLTAGLVLMGLGTLWTGRIAARVERAL